MVATVAVVSSTITEIEISSLSVDVAIVGIIWKRLSRDCCYDIRNTRIQFAVV